ncbi:unnamed protein product [Amoebophrya sp. A25]|nr:unnamed protein product [Amoebophrya sp. A25]|eukprot:GSA25T00010056001.1
MLWRNPILLAFSAQILRTTIAFSATTQHNHGSAPKQAVIDAAANAKLEEFEKEAVTHESALLEVEKDLDHDVGALVQSAGGGASTTKSELSSNKYKISYFPTRTDHDVSELLGLPPPLSLDQIGSLDAGKILDEESPVKTGAHTSEFSASVQQQGKQLLRSENKDKGNKDKGVAGGSSPKLNTELLHHLAIAATRVEKLNTELLHHLAIAAARVEKHRKRWKLVKQSEELDFSDLKEGDVDREADDAEGEEESQGVETALSSSSVHFHSTSPKSRSRTSTFHEQRSFALWSNNEAETYYEGRKIPMTMSASSYTDADKKAEEDEIARALDKMNKIDPEKKTSMLFVVWNAPTTMNRLEVMLSTWLGNDLSEEQVAMVVTGNRDHETKIEQALSELRANQTKDAQEDNAAPALRVFPHAATHCEEKMRRKLNIQDVRTDLLYSFESRTIMGACLRVFSMKFAANLPSLRVHGFVNDDIYVVPQVLQLRLEAAFADSKPAKQLPSEEEMKKMRSKGIEPYPYTSGWRGQHTVNLHPETFNTGRKAIAFWCGNGGFCGGMGSWLNKKAVDYLAQTWSWESILGEARGAKIWGFSEDTCIGILYRQMERRGELHLIQAPENFGGFTPGDVPSCQAIHPPAVLVHHVSSSDEAKKFRTERCPPVRCKNGECLLWHHEQKWLKVAA